MSRTADKLISLGYGVGWSAAGLLPADAAYRIADSAAGLAMSRRGPAVVQYAKNLRRVLGPGASPHRLWEETAAGLRSYARYWLEIFRLPSMDRNDVAERCSAESYGMEYLAAGVSSGRGVVAVLPHSGNWDVAGMWLANQYGSLTSVAERLEPDSLYRRFLTFRQSLGMEILPLTGGATPASSVLKDRLRAGRIVCLMGDRDLSAGGVPVTFFGEPTRMPAGPAMLAAVTGADLCAVHLSFSQVGNERGWRTDVSPPIELAGARLAERVRFGTQALAAQFERDIAGRPADWHMLQPLWMADLPPGHAARAATGPPGVADPGRAPA